MNILKMKMQISGVTKGLYISVEQMQQLRHGKPLLALPIVCAWHGMDYEFNEKYVFGWQFKSTKI